MTDLENVTVTLNGYVVEGWDDDEAINVPDIRIPPALRWVTIEEAIVPEQQQHYLQMGCTQCSTRTAIGMLLESPLEAALRGDDCVKGVMLCRSCFDAIDEPVLPLWGNDSPPDQTAQPSE